MYVIGVRKPMFNDNLRISHKQVDQVKSDLFRFQVDYMLFVALDLDVQVALEEEQVLSLEVPVIKLRWKMLKKCLDGFKTY